jgi:hypothetical protein
VGTGATASISRAENLLRELAVIRQFDPRCEFYEVRCLRRGIKSCWLLQNMSFDGKEHDSKSSARVERNVGPLTLILA